MNRLSMKLKVLLPYRVFIEKDDVMRIVAETSHGSFGFLPRRLDCAAPLVPGILTYESIADGEVHIAVDEGLLVKTGAEVLVSVRSAIGGTELEELHAAVEREFLKRDQREQSTRSVLAKMESGLIRSLIEFHHER